VGSEPLVGNAEKSHGRRLLSSAGQLKNYRLALSREEAFTALILAWEIQMIVSFSGWTAAIARE
jgi:hypothetical protein